MGPMEGRVILCCQVLALELTQIMPCDLNQLISSFLIVSQSLNAWV